MNNSAGIIAVSFAAAVCVLLSAAVAFGGPSTPPPMSSINAPFKAVDFSSMPVLESYQAADGATLYFRRYEPAGAVAIGSAVLIHGSSASSNSLHPMAKALAASGLRAYALDVRGHGASGQRGQIAFVGELESDLQAFVNAVRPQFPSTLVGFSAGGGFALRVAASAMQSEFQSYLLLSPFLGREAANQRPNSGGWVSVGIPRVVGLLALNAVGVSAFNWLPVTRFALSDEAKQFLTPEYGFNLAMNFSPHQDFVGDIRAANGKVAVLAGSADEAFYTDKLESVVRAAGKQWPVKLLTGIGHIPLTLEPMALDAIVKQVSLLQHEV